MKQTTLKSEFRCSGIGLHSGRKVGLVVKPAPANTGIVFAVGSARDLVIPKPEKVVATGLATTIGSGSVRVSTVEHLLAAFVGLEVDNAIVIVDGDEIPIMDGSAAPFVFLIKSVGIRALSEARRVFCIKKRVEFACEGKSIVAQPYPGLRVDYRISFAHAHIGEQAYSFVSTPGNFAKLISKCRTFGFLKDVEMLQKSGLARGGSLDNAVVFDDYGVVNPEGLRFVDEMVRHKILDFLGDIGIANSRIHGFFQVSCSGHEFNNKFLRHIFSHQEEYLESVGFINSWAPERRDDVGVSVATPLWA